MISFSNGASYNYGKKVARSPHQILRAHAIRVPGHAVTLFPGDYMETTVPDDISDTSLALEPRYDNKHPHWLQPEVTKSIGGITRVPNLTAEPLTLSQHEQIGQVLPVFSPKKPKHLIASVAEVAQATVKPTNSRHSATVTIDPDEILPTKHRDQMHELLTEFDSVSTETTKAIMGQLDHSKHKSTWDLPNHLRERAGYLSVLEINSTNYKKNLMSFKRLGYL